jgi:hypothetical protein
MNLLNLQIIAMHCDLEGDVKWQWIEDNLCHQGFLRPWHQLWDPQARKLHQVQRAYLRSRALLLGKQEVKFPPWVGAIPNVWERSSRFLIQPKMNFRLQMVLPGTPFFAQAK